MNTCPMHVPAQVVLMYAPCLAASVSSARESHPRLHMHQALAEERPPPATCPSSRCAGGLSWSIWHGKCCTAHQEGRTPSWTPGCSDLLETFEADVPGEVEEGRELCYPSTNTDREQAIGIQLQELALALSYFMSPFNRFLGCLCCWQIWL